MAVFSPHLGAKPSAINRLLVHYSPILKNSRHHDRRAGSNSGSGATSPARLFVPGPGPSLFIQLPKVGLLRSSGRRDGPTFLYSKLRESTPRAAVCHTSGASGLGP